MLKDINLSMSVLPNEVIDEIQTSLNEIKDFIHGKAKAELSEDWLESTEARKVLGVSAKTWQTYRDRRIIPFSQVGRKIYVKRADIDKFLNDHAIRQSEARRVAE